MKRIEISVQNRVAWQTNGTEYICGNGDFVIDFIFDGEWAKTEVKTARFIHGGEHTDIVFTGNSCEVPKIFGVRSMEVGVYAGDLKTTTSANVKCKKSILCGSGVPSDPSPDVYAQLMEMISNLTGVDPEMVAEAIAEYMGKNPITETDPTVPEWAKQPTKPGYTAKEVGALAEADLQTAVNTALTQAKASGEFDGADGKDGKDGYTPVKGVDYFDGANGQDGYTPQKGIDYFDGKDGTNGKDGADGKTPIKGTDYYTEADKTEMVNAVLSALPTWTGGSY